MVKWRNPIPEKDLKDWEKVAVQSKSGGIIKGLFAKSKSEIEKATIVLGHPMGKEAKGYFIKRGYTELLRNAGFNVLIFDINGFGESSHGNFLFYEDIVAIGGTAKALCPELPLGYFGISLGGQWSTIAFTDKNHLYDFAIIESAATSLDEFWIQYPLAYRTLKLLNVFLPKYAKKVKMIERIKEVNRLNSLLLIYSENDLLIPFEMGKKFQKNSSVPTELWSVQDAKHAEIMKSNYRSEYQEKILDYFNTESIKSTM